MCRTVGLKTEVYVCVAVFVCVFGAGLCACVLVARQCEFGLFAGLCKSQYQRCFREYLKDKPKVWGHPASVDVKQHKKKFGGDF